MEVCKFYPVANDRMGAIWTLSSIKNDICVIEFGPAGTTHYAIEGIGSLNGQEGARIYSTHMDQDDVTFGKYERLEHAIIELDEHIKPKYIFVMASSISSIIGADIESICFELEGQVKAKLVAVTTGGLKDQYQVGVEQMLMTLVKEVVKPGNSNLKKYNILGMTIDKFNYLSDVEELKRMMAVLFNKEVNTIFTCHTSIEEIENATEASLNIVVRREGLKAAEYLKNTYGIPYLYPNLYGMKNLVAFVKSVETIEGYELNQEAYDYETAALKSHLFSLKRSLFLYKETKKSAIFGDYDTVHGMRDLMLELGLEIDRSEILHKATVEMPILAGKTELERMNYLKDQPLLLLLGDGSVSKMDHQAKSYLQISNPNFDRRMIYPFTPFIGFRGMLYMIEKILNIE